MYENITDKDTPSTAEIRKRIHDDLSDDDEEDDYRKALNQYSSQAIENEFDRYLNTPPPPSHEQSPVLNGGSNTSLSFVALHLWPKISSQSQVLEQELNVCLVRVVE